MLDSITGVVVDKSHTHISLAVGGIAMMLRVSVRDLINVEQNSTQTLYTHLQVKEENLLLYGFRDKVDREVFLLLLSVSGVGSKMAMKIIDGVSVENLVERMREEDWEGLSKSVKGLGKKMCIKIGTDLRDPILEKSFVWLEKKGPVRGVNLQRIISALLNIGYKETEIQWVLKKLSTADPKDSEEVLLKKALLELASST